LGGVELRLETTPYSFFSKSDGFEVTK